MIFSIAENDSALGMRSLEKESEIKHHTLVNMLQRSRWVDL